MGIAAIAAIVIVVAAVSLIVRGWDVRLVLILAAMAIALTSGLKAESGGKFAALALVVREFLATFCNEKFVVPICSAMGFAYAGAVEPFRAGQSQPTHCLFGAGTHPPSWKG